jgi:hypothetical protein
MVCSQDSYALPKSEEILVALGGNHYYTVLDMKSGYHQVEVEESHKQRTVFTVTLVYSIKVFFVGFGEDNQIV